MGYKKLDEVMELLSDELEGFNKSIKRLEKLTQNVDNVNIKADTSNIEYYIQEHLKAEREKLIIRLKQLFEILKSSCLSQE